MMYAGICISGIAFLLTACKGKGKPDILSPDVMQVVLWDMLRADEMAMSENIKDTIRTNYLTHSVNAYQQVFAIHHITKEQFYASLHYYQERPDKNKELIDSVQALGNRIKAGYERKDSLDRVAQLKKDSIRLKSDSAKLKQDSARLKTDSTKLKADTARLNAEAVKLKADAARKLLANSIITKAEQARKEKVIKPASMPMRRAPLTRLRNDSLIKTRLQPGALQKPIH